MKVQTAQRMRATKSIRLQEVQTAQQTRATESTYLQGGPDADAMIAYGGSILCNRPDSRVAGPNTLQCLLEVLVAGLDPRGQVGTLPMQIRV